MFCTFAWPANWHMKIFTLFSTFIFQILFQSKVQVTAQEVDALVPVSIWGPTKGSSFWNWFSVRFSNLSCFLFKLTEPCQNKAVSSSTNGTINWKNVKSRQALRNVLEWFIKNNTQICSCLHWILEPRFRFYFGNCRLSYNVEGNKSNIRVTAQAFTSLLG